MMTRGVSTSVTHLFYLLCREEIKDDDTWSKYIRHSFVLLAMSGRDQG